VYLIEDHILFYVRLFCKVTNLKNKLQFLNVFLLGVTRCCMVDINVLDGPPVYIYPEDGGSRLLRSVNNFIPNRICHIREVSNFQLKY
jgi:hypothetical protein